VPKYALAGKLTTDVQDRDALIEILSAAADLMENAEGCQMYIVYKDAKDDTAIWVTELWDSQADHDNSLSIAGVSDLIARARPLIKSMSDQIVLIPIHGKGLRD
jgi:quinol monooxygenase YgiN